MLFKHYCLIGHIIFLYGFSAGHLFVGTSLINWLFNEPRAISVILEDIGITHQISKKISDNIGMHHQLTNITIITYNHTVLLAGQAPNQELKKYIYDYAFSIPTVKNVFDQIKIAPPTNAWRRIQDKLLTLEIRAKLLLTSNVRYHRFQIQVENGEVFILGKSDYYQANKIGCMAQHSKGVKKIIKLIEPV